MESLDRKYMWMWSILCLALSAIACGVDFEMSPGDLEESDLVGTWVAEYSTNRSDTLELRADGTFRQTYKDTYENGYRFQTPWNEWYLERLPNDQVRVHLAGARYYLAGRSLRTHLDTLVDPFAEEWVDPQNELLLNVQMESGRGLVLHHMWITDDRGFAQFGGDKEFFRRIDSP